MAIKGYFLCASSTVFAIIVLVISSCAFSRDMDSKFPAFPVVAQIDVFKLDTIPEQKLCTIEGSKNSGEFIALLSKRYPKNWHGPSQVSLAPAYRLVAGTTEILILKRGIAISTTVGSSRQEVFVHDFNLGEAEELVHMACKSARAE